MLATPDACASFRFSTDGLPERARDKAVRELYEHALLPGKLEPLEPLPDCTVRADIAQSALPGLGILSGMLCGLRQYARPGRSAYPGDDDLFLGINLAGRSTAQQRGREVALGDGDAVLATRGATGFTINRPTPVQFIGLRVPRRAIAPLTANLDDAVIRLVPHDTDALRLLVRYIRIITEDEPPQPPELRRLVVTQVYDLIALTVGATRDAALVAQGRGVRAARLRAITSDIAATLDDCGLTVAAVAARHRVTPRYVHKLLAGEGTTFSEVVLGQRLARAHRMLTDPRLADRAISSVAFDVGFGDLSYFNRAFRRRFGATPSEVRHAAK